MKTLMFVVAVVMFGGAWSGDTAEACRKVGRPEGILIAPNALQALKMIDFSEDDVFAALTEVSIPEANGCWGGATGDFDDQLLSVGASQWNFGQKTLQPLLSKFRKKYASDSQWNDVITKLMSMYGTKFMSTGCLRQPVTQECKTFILSKQSDSGQLDKDFKAEVDALFESDVMIQIQTDTFVTLLTSVVSDIKRLFPEPAPRDQRLRQIKWAIDMKVQQGGFPGEEDIKRIRKRHERADHEARQKTIQAGISPEQADLILLTHLRSRVANSKSGIYQALTVQRRVKIALGLGSVAGRGDGI